MAFGRNWIMTAKVICSIFEQISLVFYLTYNITRYFLSSMCLITTLICCRCPTTQVIVVLNCSKLSLLIKILKKYYFLDLNIYMHNISFSNCFFRYG